MKTRCLQENQGRSLQGVFNKGEGAYDVTELVVIQDPLPIDIRIDGENIGEEDSPTTGASWICKRAS